MRDADFERLYAEHAQRLFAYLVYRTGDRALAEDVLSDTFERALRGRRGFDRRKASERTWLYAIALNRVRDLQRRESREAVALERAAAGAAHPGPELDLDRLESRDVVERVLDVLSAEERETVGLRFGADLKLEEIAQLIGEPRTTVEARLYRALRKLRETLE